jgi:hypothetical protein
MDIEAATDRCVFRANAHRYEYRPWLGY